MRNVVHCFPTGSLRQSSWPVSFAPSRGTDRNLLFTYTLEDSGALTTRVWAMAGTPELAKFLFGETAEPKQHTLIYDQVPLAMFGVGWATVIGTTVKI